MESSTNRMLIHSRQWSGNTTWKAGPDESVCVGVRGEEGETCVYVCKGVGRDLEGV